MTIEEAEKLDHFVCAECSSDDDVKKSQNGFAASPADDVKVRGNEAQKKIISRGVPYEWPNVRVPPSLPTGCSVF
ncbi:unnamed protein product [Brassica napus]|uniref:(rape) hypothetical protein n=1 Tax=Brassica napus TaxID=3708 RepID=A0A816VYH2_BRANA|nr:unnamed protein product [Brassica napus]